MRIKPETHRIFARAEDIDIAHAIDAREFIANLKQRVIAGEKRIERPIRRDQMHDHCDVRRLLFRCHADALHFGREHRDRDGDTILHQHLSGIEIGAELESDAQCQVTVASALRRHVEHVLDAIDLLLDWRRHRFRYNFCVCAGIIGRHLNSGWRDIGILRDRKGRKRDDANERDDDADHAGKDRPVDKKVREVHSDRRCA